MTPFLLNSAASLLMFAWCLVHFFVGGKEVARPLRDDESLDGSVRATLWMCWHMVTATIFVGGVLFGLASLPFAGAYVFGLAGTLVSAGLAAAGLVSALVLRVSYGVLPQGWLFVPVVALGIAAAVLAR